MFHRIDIPVRSLMMGIVLLAILGHPSQEAVAGATVRSDFNGDGYADVAVGAPGEDLGTLVDAGLVHVLYGTTGTFPSAEQIWHLDSPGVPLDAATGDRFGEVLAGGDFNGDGYGDLAVGMPNKDGTRGQVIVMYGSAAGLVSAGSQVWNQDILEDIREIDDRFGAALVAGDFNADGYDELAIGVPGEDFPDIGPPTADPPRSVCANGVCLNAGIVNLVFGRPDGLTSAGNQLWHQDCGVTYDGWVEWQDRFGSSLAIGDFNGDAVDDLAVGVPGEHTGSSDIPGRNHGAVSVYYGRAGVGLTGNGAQYLRQWAEGVVGDPQPNDALGYAVATGDFNGDGFDDLAAGVPGKESVTPAMEDAGAVVVFYGQAISGLSAADSSRNEIIFRSTMGLGDGVPGARWGLALAAGDFDADGFADLAVGAPMDHVDSAIESGSVSILFGGPSRFTASGNQFFSQNTPGMLDGAQSYDWFGHTLTVGDVNGDAVADLIVGVPFENLGQIANGGAINLLTGAAGVGVTTVGNLFVTQDGAGENAETGDQFGGRWLPILLYDPWPTEPLHDSVTPLDQQPFGDSPWPVPGILEAEHYDTGGEGVAYHDTTAGNAGEPYRADDVDIFYSAAEGYFTGDHTNGEWLEYTVDVEGTNDYRFDLRVATPTTGCQLRLALDGVDITEPISLPNTGDGQTWQTVSTTATLTTGRHVLRVTVVVGGFNFGWMAIEPTGGAPTAATPTLSPDGGAFDGPVTVSLQTSTPGATIHFTVDGSDPTTASTAYTAPFTLTDDATVKAFAVAAGYLDSAVASATFTVAGGGGGQQPYGGTPWPLPGILQMEDYDTGGEAIAYHDLDAGNNGGQYRTDDVDIWLSAAEGYYVGGTRTGEWLEYTVDVAAAGEYRMDLRVATPNTGRQLSLALDGVDVTGPVTLPNTGGWQNWQTASATLTLTAGRHVLRVTFVAGGLNITWIDFDAASLMIETAAIPEALQKSAYQAPLEGVGGTPPYAWSIGGGELPEGLSIGSADGIIAGSPIECGTFDFTVHLRDAVDDLATRTYQLNVVCSGDYAISGTITGAGGVTVTLSGDASDTTTSDGSGAYRFEHLANGTYTITPSLAAYDFDPASRTVTIDNRDVSDANFSTSMVDTDGDGLPDAIEATGCTQPDDPDSDDDGLLDGTEDANHNGSQDPGETDPCDWDSDGDAMPDGWEVANNLDPLVDDAAGDRDNDGFSNRREYVAGTGADDITDTPAFEAEVEDFESGDLNRFPWLTGGDARWAVTTTNPSDGGHAAQAGPIGDDQITALEISRYTEAGDVRFWYAVDAEPGYDWLNFYLDGSLAGQWSGSVAYAQAVYPLTTGMHHFRWEYATDDAGSAGSDTAWIDTIAFPGFVDSDGDGMPDGWEIDHGLEPLLDDAGEDTDNDLFTNLMECLMGTDPRDPGDYPVMSRGFDADLDVDGSDLKRMADGMVRGIVTPAEVGAFAEGFGR